ncbi:hypothetical protein IFM12275_24200 [Nocardia sputorum]|nr:hypothetical protein IFM12275_24200 [Nocardia sputorum]
MNKSMSWYPSLKVDGTGSGVASQAVRWRCCASPTRWGLDRALSQALAPWRKPLAVHDLVKTVLDLAVSIAIGGDCAADLSVLGVRA